MTLRGILSLAVSLSLGFVACDTGVEDDGQDSDERTSDTDPNETDDTTAEACADAVTDCCCFGPTEAQGSSSAILTPILCESTELCPTVGIQCAADDEKPWLSGYDCDVASMQLTTEASASALECSLQAIASNEVGHVSFEVRDGSIGNTDRFVRLYLTGAGEAFALEQITNDLSESAEPIVRIPLASQEERDVCAASTDLATQLSCLVEVSLEAGTTCEASGA